MKFSVRNRDQLFRYADRFEIKRFDNGQIDEIQVYNSNDQIHLSKARYDDIGGFNRMVGIDGFLMPEIWGSQEQPKLEWYDRNPKPIVQFFGNLVTNESETTEWSYTVPVKRKAYLELMRLYAIQVIMDNNSRCELRMKYTPVGGSATNLIYLRFARGATLNSPEYVMFGQTIFMNAGDVLSFSHDYTGALADPKQCYVEGVAKATEFDA